MISASTPGSIGNGFGSRQPAMLDPNRLTEIPMEMPQLVPIREHPVRLGQYQARRKYGTQIPYKVIPAFRASPLITVGQYLPAIELAKKLGPFATLAVAEDGTVHLKAMGPNRDCIGMVDVPLYVNGGIDRRNLRTVGIVDAVSDQNWLIGHAPFYSMPTTPVVSTGLIGMLLYALGVNAQLAAAHQRGNFLDQAYVRPPKDYELEALARGEGGDREFAGTDTGLFPPHKDLDKSHILEKVRFGTLAEALAADPGVPWGSGIVYGLGAQVSQPAAQLTGADLVVYCLGDFSNVWLRDLDPGSRLQVQTLDARPGNSGFRVVSDAIRIP